MEQNPRISEKLHVRIPGKEEDKRVRKNFAYIEKASSSQPDVVVDRVVVGIVVEIRQNQDNIVVVRVAVRIIVKIRQNQDRGHLREQSKFGQKKTQIKTNQFVKCCTVDRTFTGQNIVY